MPDEAKDIAGYLAEMQAAEARFVIKSRYAPLACRRCGVPNGPPHPIEANYPDWTCPACRADLHGLLDV